MFYTYMLKLNKASPPRSLKFRRVKTIKTKFKIVWLNIYDLKCGSLLSATPTLQPYYILLFKQQWLISRGVYYRQIKAHGSRLLCKVVKMFKTGSTLKSRNALVNDFTPSNQAYFFCSTGHVYFTTSKQLL